MNDSIGGGPGRGRKDQGDHGEESLRLKRAVGHPVRRDVLRCLDSEPVSVSRVSARIGTNEKRTSYHLEVLCSVGLVTKTDDGEDGSVYVARRSS
jgi:predicted transcriptional regulator